MRKAVVTLTILALISAMPAALAQEGRRDPFEPLIEEDAGVVVVPVAPGSDAPSGDADDGSTGSGTGMGEGTPNTGMATTDWTGLAYLLIVMGAAAVTLARLRRPIMSASRRR